MSEVPRMRHTEALPRSTWRERIYYRVFGFNPPSVVKRRLEALAKDELELDAMLRARGLK